MEAVILQTLRTMAWERAKAELLSLLATYWDGPDNAKQYMANRTRIHEFIDAMRGNI